MNIGLKLKAIRLAEEIERDEMSQLVDIPRGTIRNYEQGVNNPRSDILTKITNHERFKKYAYWLMTDDVLPASGQVSPDFSILLRCGIIHEENINKRA